MLPQQQRIRTAGDFSTTRRSGTRYGGRNFVVFVNNAPDRSISRAGFIVSKAVGNAVTRNKVKRRARNVMRELLGTVSKPDGIDQIDVVVRALPPAAEASFDQIQTELEKNLAGALRKLGRRNEVA